MFASVARQIAVNCRSCVSCQKTLSGGRICTFVRYCLRGIMRVGQRGYVLLNTPWQLRKKRGVRSEERRRKRLNVTTRNARKKTTTADIFVALFPYVPFVYWYLVPLLGYWHALRRVYFV